MKVDSNRISSRLRASLEEIETASDEFGRFVVEVFDTLDHLSDELFRRREAWQREQAAAREELDRRAAQLAQERSELEGHWQQVLTRIEEHRQSDGAIASPDESVQAFLEEAGREAQAMRDVAVASEEQTRHIAELVDELSKVRGEILAVREEIRTRPERANSGGVAGTDESQLHKLQEELLEAERERTASEKERIALENELESVRNRAADMADAVAEQRRQMERQQGQMAAELKRMRKSMETMAQRRSERLPAAVGTLVDEEIPPPPPATRVPEPAMAAPSPSDPVVDSVMAQFQILQKDIARRREARASS